MKNVKYFVNEEKGVVVAKLDKDVVEKELAEVYEKIGKTGKYLGVIVDMDLFNSLVTPITAKAVCAPGDVFVEEVGKAIARKKLFAKLAVKKTALCWKIAKIYNEETSRIISIASKYDKQIQTAIEEVKDYIQVVCE